MLFICVLLCCSHVYYYVVHMCTIMLFTSVLLCCVSIYDVHFVVLVWAAAI